MAHPSESLTLSVVILPITQANPFFQEFVTLGKHAFVSVIAV
jgi:hypothetical protein